MLAKKTPAELFSYLDSLEIIHKTIEHQPVFTAAEAIHWKDLTPGLHCKNLFLENKNGSLFLVTMPAFEKADLNSISQQLQSGRLSFAKPEKMDEILGVAAGHATPFALLNQSAKEVQIVLDQQVPIAPALNVHPLTNSASTILSGADLLKFIQALGHTPIIVTACMKQEKVT